MCFGYNFGVACIKGVAAGLIAGSVAAIFAVVASKDEEPRRATNDYIKDSVDGDKNKNQPSM